MTNFPFDFDITHDLSPLATWIGEIALEWNSIQSRMYLMFLGLSGTRQDIASSIYTSIKNDRSQRDVLRAVGEIALKDHAKLLSKFVKLLKDIDTEQLGRNAVVHGWLAVDKDGYIGKFPFGAEGQNKSKDKHFREYVNTLRDLNTRAVNLLKEMYDLPSWPELNP